MIGKPKAQAKSKAKTKFTTIDEYLAAVDNEPHRAALEKLRKQIKAAAPKAEECISYGIPAFRQDGMLVGFGAAAKYCSFYPMSSSTVAMFREELAGFSTSIGTIRFTPDNPIPSVLVKKLVKARLAENGAGLAKCK